MNKAVHALFLFVFFVFSNFPLMAKDYKTLTGQSSKLLGISVLRNLLVDNTDNIFFSPIALTHSVLPYYLSAAGYSQEDLADGLRFQHGQDLTNEKVLNSARLDFSIFSKTNRSRFGFKMGVHVSLWKDSTPINFEPLYLSLLQSHLGLNVYEAAEPVEVSLEGRIYQTIKESLHIKEVPPVLGLSSDLRGPVAVGASQLSGSWLYPFDRSKTVAEDFLGLEGRKHTVAMMDNETGVAPLKYVESPLYQAIALPLGYSNNSPVEIVIIKPDDWATYIRVLNLETLEKVLINLEKSEWKPLRVRLPRITIDSNRNLNQTLKKSGLTDLFDGSGEFSSLYSSQKLYVNTVLQYGSLKVREDGLWPVAKVSDHAKVGLKKIHQIANLLTRDKKKLTFVGNKPLLIVVRDRLRDSYLFLGAYLNP